MSKLKRKNTGGYCKPHIETAQAFTEAIINRTLGFDLDFVVELLQDNGFPACMTVPTLLEFLRDCGWVRANGTASAKALERELLLEELETEMIENGRTIARYSFRLSGKGLVSVVTALIEAREEVAR